MSFFQDFLGELPSQVFQTILVDFVVAALTWLGVTTLRGMITSGKGAFAGIRSVGDGINNAFVSLKGIGTYNPFAFLWRAGTWLLFAIFVVLKFLGPVILIYAALAFYFSTIEDTDYRAIYILPGLIVGATLAFKGGRKLVGTIGWSVLVFPLTFYLAGVFLLNLTFWATLPLVAFTSIFFNVSLSEYWTIWSDSIGVFFVHSWMWELNFAELMTSLEQTSVPPLSPLILYPTLLIAGLFSLYMTMYAAYFAAVTRPPKS